MVRIICVFLTALSFMPSYLSAKLAPGSPRPSKLLAGVIGGDVTPSTYRDTTRNQNLKVAATYSIWEYERKLLLHGKGTSFGFEGEWGKERNWTELRFFVERSQGLYFLGNSYNSMWSLLYSNIGGASLGPIVEVSTRSWLSQGIGLKVNLWHMIGPIGILFDVRILTTKGLTYTGGFMARLAFPIYF